MTRMAETFHSQYDEDVTALVTLENANVEDEVVISKRAQALAGQSSA